MHLFAFEPDRTNHLAAFAPGVMRGPSPPSEVQKAIDAGWTQEAVYDAITVCALFNFYNTWIDVTGVADTPAEAYAMSGKRLATAGYQGRS